MTAENDDTRKGPVFLGAAPDATDPVYKYTKGVEERRERLQKERRGPSMPSVAAADANWSAERDGHTTPAKLQQALSAVDAAEAEAPPSAADQQLAEAKVAGDAHAKAFFKGVDEMSSTSPKTLQDPPEKGEGRLSDEDRDELEQGLERIDDLRLQEMLRRITTDPINNEEQRAIADERANAEDPLDIGRIISEGVATQWVTISKGKLRVLFRQTSPWEDQEIRRILSDLVAKGPENGGIHDDVRAEVYGLMQMVCTVVQINEHEYPKHLSGGISRMVFNDEVFMQKYAAITRQPGSLTHVLSTHAWWFDARVRRLFSMDSLKNG